MDSIEVDDYIYDTAYISESEAKSEEDMLRGYTIEGNWDEVEELYKSHRKCSTIKINESRGTALHVAVNDNNGDVVKNLLASIISHNNEEALKCVNENGDTPLHLAASRGFKDICKCIIGENDERKHLILIDNKNGENPLFLAALSWQKQTFVYLSELIDNYSYIKDLIRDNGDSILHCAIRREFFGIPVGILNVKEAVKYYTKKQESSSPNNCPENYDTCYLFFQKCNLFFQKCNEKLKGVLVKQTTSTEYGLKNMGEKQKVLQNDQHRKISMQSKHKLLPDERGSKDKEEKPKHKFLPENYATCLWFMKLACIYILGLSGVGVEEIKKMKQKHKWSGQLLNRFMENTYKSCLVSGAKPGNVTGTDFFAAYKPNQGENNSETKNLTAAQNDIFKKLDKLITQIPNISPTIESETKNLTKAKEGMVEIVDKLIAKIRKISLTLESETVILTAARNGIIEIVDEFIKKIPSSIYELNLENKNVLLVAVENRRTNVVEALRKWLEKRNEKAVFDNLIQGVDNEENTVLHLAATRSDLDWHISGAALQMMWHIKWFQYTKGLVPEHFTIRTNKEDKTAVELFKKSYAELVTHGSEWLKDTSNSCSVVAALLAGVSFATSSTVPGGNKSDTGEPTLEGKPAFDAFAMSSITGLCFSVTALIMFLSILTSRKEARDFRIDLPRKLLLGLSSLFLSIIAMFITFCSGYFFLIDHKFKHIVFLIYAVISFPVTLYAVAQLPLYIDLLIAIVTEVPKTSGKGENI